MGSLPLHPIVVHVPMALVILLPLVSIFFLVLYKWNVLEKKSSLFIIFLQLLLLGSTYVALETGEEQEERVEKVVGHDVIETHEERAETFMYAVALTFFLSLGIYLAKDPKVFSSAILGLIVLQLGLGFLGYRVGHSGGELVYKHGAASAYTVEGKYKEEEEYE